MNNKYGIDIDGTPRKSPYAPNAHHELAKAMLESHKRLVTNYRHGGLVEIPTIPRKKRESLWARFERVIGVR